MAHAKKTKEAKEDNRLAFNFLIDTTDRRVFCRSCGALCSKLPLPSFDLFWCPEPVCSNVNEARYYGQENRWQFCPASMIWEDVCIQRSLKDLMSEIELEINTNGLGTRKESHAEI